MADQEESKNKSNWKKMIPPLLGVVLGFLFGLYLLSRIFSGSWTPAMMLRLILFIAVALFINIHLHELGHCITGSAFGYKLISYRVGVLAWNYENGRLRFSIMKSRGYSGMCAMLPPDKELAPWQQILFYSGGLLVNYLTALVFGLAAYRMEDGQTLRLFLLVMAATAFFLAVANSFPLIVGNNPTDGNLLWAILRNKPSARKMVLLNRYTSSLAAGTRPRDLNLPENGLESKPDIYDLTLQIYRYFQALDRREFLEARKIIGNLQRRESVFPFHALPSLYYEICFNAAIQGDREKAKVFYRKAGPILLKDKDVNGYRVKAYYYFYVKKFPQEALGLAEKGLFVAELFPLKGQACMEKDLLKDLIQTIQGGGDGMDAFTQGPVFSGDRDADRQNLDSD